jgi:hypothetical protein
MVTPADAPDPVGDRRAPWPLVAAMFLTTLVTLALQVCVSRIMSVTLSYHFAFLIVACAMLGMAASAVTVFLERKGGATAKRLGAPAAAQIAAVLITLGTFGFVFMRADALLLPVQVAASGCALAIAFYYAGYIVAYMLARYAKDVVRLYLIDLLGACVGCIVAVLLLNRFSAPAATLVCAWASAAAGVLLARALGTQQNQRIGVLLFAALTCVTSLALVNPALTRLRFAKLKDQRHVVWERWNSLARVSVKPSGPPNAAWGISELFEGTVPEILWLELDADAGTPIIRNGGKAPPEQTDFLKWDVTASGYWLRPSAESVFIIGGGGGRDVLTAVGFGAKRVDVVEINPAVIEASRDVFGEYSGGVYSLPQVSLAVGNARSSLARRDTRYDLIQMSMIDTWAASMAGSLVLTENTLYTQEAYGLFLSHLKDDGILSISRWYDRSDYGEVARVLSLMGDALERSGAPNPSAHIAVLYTRGQLGQAVATCLMKRSPFAPAEIGELADLGRRMGFKLIWPRIDQATSEAIDVRGIVERDPTLMKASIFDLTPPTDERPFFFNTRKPLESWVAALRDRDLAEGSRSSGLLVCTLLALVAIGYRLLVSPLRAHGLTPRHLLLSTHRGPTAYFAGIGVGFMLIELALIQRYIVFLGHPTYGLSVVLFSLLLFTGVGSFLSGRMRRMLTRQIRWPILCVGAGALARAFLVPPLLLSLQAWSESARIALAMALIAPLATCMGMIFPTGIRILTARGLEELVPWMWGVNGFAAVIASVVGMMIATAWGYTAVIVLAVLAYGLTLAATRALDTGAGQMGSP